MGVGQKVVQALISKAPHTCIHLTSTFGNEPFYERIGFRKHKTAMAIYPEQMKNSPYLEPSNFGCAPACIATREELRSSPHVVKL